MGGPRVAAKVVKAAILAGGISVARAVITAAVSAGGDVDTVVAAAIAVGVDIDTIIAALIAAGVASAAAEDAVAAFERIEFIPPPPIPEQILASPAE